MKLKKKVITALLIALFCVMSCGFALLFGTPNSPTETANASTATATVYYGYNLDEKKLVLSANSLSGTPYAATENSIDTSEIPYDSPFETPDNNAISTVEILNTISPKNTGAWFKNFKNLKTILGLNNLDTSNVGDMEYMFKGCSSLESIDLRTFRTSSSLMFLQNMFEGCKSLKSIDLSSFTTDGVTNISCMFDGCTSLTTVNMKGLNFSQASVVYYIFNNCNNLYKLITPNSIYQYSADWALPFAFNDSNGNTVDRISSSAVNKTLIRHANVYWWVNEGELIISSVDETPTKDANSFSSEAEYSITADNTWHKSLGADIANLTSVKVINGIAPKNVNNWFKDFTNVTSIDLSGLDLSCVSTTMTDTFTNCTNLIKIITPDTLNMQTGVSPSLPCNYWDGTKSISNLTNTDAGKTLIRKHTFNETACSICNATLGNFYWWIEDKVLTISTKNEASASVAEGEKGEFEPDLEFSSSNYAPWKSKEITSAKIVNGVSPKSMDYWFLSCTQLQSVDFSGLDTSRLERTNFLFQNCSSLTLLDLSYLNTSQVKYMTYMFYNCSSLTGTAGVDGTAIKFGSNFNTNNVTNVCSMFSGCTGLTVLDVSTFDLSNATATNTLQNVFQGVKKIIAPKAVPSSGITLDGNYWNGSSISKKITSADAGKTFTLHAEHSGGTATCSQKAKCSLCGEEYGELASHNYDESTGNCSDCNQKITVRVQTGEKVKFYTDSDLEKAWKEATVETTSYITLLSDVNSIPTWPLTPRALNVPADKTVNLYLNGKKLVYPFGSSYNSSVITVQGTLHIYDSAANIAEAGNYAYTPKKNEISDPCTSNIVNIYTGVITGGKGYGDTKIGGGIYVMKETGYTGALYLHGGTIAGNEADYGGGIRVNGYFEMTGGTVAYNKANKDGGGIYIDNSTVLISGGEIRGNTATNLGNGIIASAATNEELHVTGSAKISDNLYLKNNEKLYYGDGDAAYTETAKITLTLVSGYTGAFTSGFGTINPDLNYTKVFAITSANPLAALCVYKNGDKELEAKEGHTYPPTYEYNDTKHWLECTDCGYRCADVHSNGEGGCSVCGAQHVASVTAPDGATTNYFSIEAAWAAALEKATPLTSWTTTTVKLLQDVTIKETLLIQDKDITLDLNDKVLKADFAGSVIKVAQSTTTGNALTRLVIKDTAATKTAHEITVDARTVGGTAGQTTTVSIMGGVITGGNAANGGGIYASYAFLTIEGGTIAGNRNEPSSGYGGGVYVTNDTVFSISNNAAISYNVAGSDGGGMYADNRSNVTIGDSAKISYNYADHNSGGMYVSGDSTVAISGNATISNNLAPAIGGIYLYGTLSISGAPKIKDNHLNSGELSNINVSDKSIQVAGELTSGAEIWVGDNAEIYKFGEYNIGTNPNTYFKCDDTRLCIRYDSIKEVHVFGAHSTPTGASTSQPTDEGHYIGCEFCVEYFEPHTWNEGEITKEPDCYKGEKTYTCTECGYTRKEDISALGHSYNPETGTCTRCGEELVAIVTQTDVSSGEVLEMVFYTTFESAWAGAVELADDKNATKEVMVTLLKDVTVTNAFTVENKWIMLDLNDKVITASGAAFDSAAIFSVKGELGQFEIIDTAETKTAHEITVDSATTDGTKTTVLIEGGVVTGGKYWIGAGIRVEQGGCFCFSGGTIAGNNAPGGNGGGVYVSLFSCFYMQGGEIAYNTAGVMGAGICATRDSGDDNKTSIEITGGKIHHNVVTQLNSNGGLGGAGIYIQNFNLLIGGTAEIGENVSNAYGGGMFIAKESTCTIEESSVISKNKAPNNQGGGIYIADNSKVIVRGYARINENYAINGGGIYIASGENLIQGNVFVSKNSAILGGGIFVGGEAKCTISEEAVVSFNSAPDNGAGGAIYGAASSTLFLHGGSIVNNTAKSIGGIYTFGAIYVSGAPMVKANRNTSDDRQDLYFGNNTPTTLTVDGKLTEEAEIWVYQLSLTIKDYKSSDPSKDNSDVPPSVYFKLDNLNNGCAYFQDGSNDVKFAAHTWQLLVGEYTNEKHFLTCANCEEIGSAAHEHAENDEGTVTKEPTCGAGERTFTCITCNNTYTVPIDPDPNQTHTWNDEWTSDAEKHWKECSICGEKSEETVHTYDEETHACSGCGKEFSVRVNRYNTIFYYVTFAEAWEAHGSNGNTLTVTLLDNVTVSETVEIANTIAGGKEVALYLNGYEWKFTGETGSVFTVGANGTLRIYDSAEGVEAAGSFAYTAREHQITDPVTNGAVTINGGLISGGKGYGDNKVGGGIYVMNVDMGISGKLYLYGGTIAGNSANQGGGVYVGGGTLEMQGGVISYNTANQGGGIYFDCPNTSVEIANVSIIKNTAAQYGGIYLETVGLFKICGATQIKGNTAGAGTPSNLYISGETPTFSVANLTSGEGDAKQNAEIWVNRAETTISGYSSNNSNVPPATYFKYDGGDKCASLNESKVVEFIAHTWVFDEMSTPTDTVHYLKCSNCGELKEEAHTESAEGEITKTPTCGEEGVKSFKCTKCGHVMRTEPIAKLNHEFSTEWTFNETHHWHAATCEHTEETKDKAEHIWNNGVETQAPTCGAAGEKTYTCTECNATKTEIILATGAHNFGTAWQHNGEKHWKECSICGEKSEETVHTYDEGTVTQAPTCSTSGVMTYTCTECNATKTEIIPATGAHNFGTAWQHNGEKHWKECTICHTKQEEAAHIEDEGTITTEPTCSTAGVKTYKCTVCGRVTKTEPIEQSSNHEFSTEWSSSETHHWHAATCEHTAEKGDYGEHTWNSGVETQAPTCIAAGEKTYTCTVCNKTKTEPIPVGQHSFGEWHDEVPATATTDGTKGYWHCSVCNKNYDKDGKLIENLVIPATGEEPPKPEQVTIIVTGGTVEGKDGTTVLVDKDGMVTVIAQEVAGKTFKGWSADGGKTLLSEDARYTFKATENMSLSAVYEEIPPVSEGLSGGAIAGITIGCLVVVLAALYATGLVLYKKGIISWKICKTLYVFLKKSDAEEHATAEKEAEQPSDENKNQDK